MALKERGLNQPERGIGDGALGFWNALEEVYPGTKHQRCRVHKTANVLNKLPKSVQPKAPINYSLKPIKTSIQKPRSAWKKIAKS